LGGKSRGFRPWRKKERDEAHPEFRTGSKWKLKKKKRRGKFVAIKKGKL